MYFFQKKCAGLFTYILVSIFDGDVDRRELVNELYLYIADKDWYVIRCFHYRSSLITYVSTVAARFFLRKRKELRSHQHVIDFQPSFTLNNKLLRDNDDADITKRISIEQALAKMPNARYRKVIEMLDLKDVRPEQLAEEMNITVDNLYNIHRRALIQLRLIMGRKEDYYD